MSSFVYFFKQSLQGFTRNLSTTLGSIVTIFLSLFIIGVFLVGAIVVDNIVKSVENEVSITAYIADDATQADIDATEEFIQGLEATSNCLTRSWSNKLQTKSSRASSSPKSRTKRTPPIR